MRIFKLFLGLVFFLIIIKSCMIGAIPLNQQFYNTKTVGIIITIDSMLLKKHNQYGSSYEVKFKTNDSLNKSMHKLDVKENLQKEISTLLNSKNKKYVFLDKDLQFDKLDKFQKPNSDKNYFYRDMRFLKKEGVDEILYLNLKYGIETHNYGLNKLAYAYLESYIINLDDNSKLFIDGFQTKNDIKGNWEKDDNLSNAIRISINEVISKFKSKF